MDSKKELDAQLAAAIETALAGSSAAASARASYGFQIGWESPQGALWDRRSLGAVSEVSWVASEARILHG
jgi:hypothetical protein